MEPLYVGIDIAKSTFTAAIWHAARGQRLGTFPNTEHGFDALGERISMWRQQLGASAIQLTMEPTAGYELALASFAPAQGWLVTLPNPRDVRNTQGVPGRRPWTAPKPMARMPSSWRAMGQRPIPRAGCRWPQTWRNWRAGRALGSGATTI